MQVGDRVGTFMWNTGRHLQCYHALPSMGAVMHTVNIRLSPAELGYIITHAEDRVILLDADLLPLLEAVDDEVLNTVELFVVCGTDEKPGGWTSTLPNAVSSRVLSLSRSAFSSSISFLKAAASLCTGGCGGSRVSGGGGARGTSSSLPGCISPIVDSTM